MSMALCDKCSLWIDTDGDSECYYQELPNGKEIELDRPRCEDCRAIEHDNYEQLHGNK